MGKIFVPVASDFPQTGNNRTRAQLVSEMLAYVGGQDDTDMVDRAGASLDSAIREFNSVLWQFNRVRQSVVLAAGADFTINGNFRASLAATLLNAANEERERVAWLPYEEFLETFRDRTGTGSFPLAYTTRNFHETGVVTVWPTLVTPLQYPTMRLEYFRRIARPGTDETVLNVPEEVEEAILQRSVSIILAKSRSFELAGQAGALAAGMREAAQMQYRDYPDF